MNRLLIAAATLALLAGCATTEEPQAVATPTAADAAKPALTPDASAALAGAQAAAVDAKAKGALWTTAEAALKAAEDAAAKGDSYTVMKQVKRVNDDVKRGLEQLNYPPVPIE